MSNSKLNVDQMLKLEQQKSLDKAIGWILILILGIIPLLTRAKVFEFISPTIDESVLTTGMKSDVFTYYKFGWLIFAVLLLLIFFTYKLAAKGYEIKKSYINVPLLIMAVFIVLSAIFAQYKNIALFGQYNRHDGTLTYLCYLALLFIGANIVFDQKKISLMFKALYIFVIVNAGLSLVYFYGHNLLQENAFFKGLFLSKGNSIGANAYISSTVNNPNYASGISGVLTVLFFMKAILSQNLKVKIIDLLFAVLSFAMLLSALSTSGFLTFVVLLPVVLLIALKSGSLKKAFATIISGIVMFTLVFTAMNYHNPRVWDESIGFLAGTSSKGTIQLQDESYAKVANELSSWINPRASAAKEEIEDPFNLPEQGWTAGTGRVYIWSETLNLVEKSPVLGYGLDTLAYFFPQNDPAKHSNINGYNIVIDKPHNIYIGLLFGSGVFAFFGFLTLIILHIWKHTFLFRGKIQNERQIALTSLFVAWCAYLVQGMFNDSIIGSAIIFWTLFGVSISLLRQEQENVQNEEG